MKHYDTNSFTAEQRFELLQVKYLNNIVEQDHRHIKRITKPMGGFRKMLTAARTLAGIELMNMIKKNQLKFTKYIDQNLTPAAQFESYIHPQIGLIMLVGLAAKNGILIVEFSKALIEGAETLISIGITVFSGVLAATIFTMFIVPIAYSLIARKTKSPNAVAEKLSQENI